MGPASRLSGVVVVLALVAGCNGGGVKVAARAADDVAHAYGASAGREIEASSTQVTRLADQAGVEEDVIRQVAPQLDQQTTWQQSVAGIRRVYARTPDELKTVAAGVACDIVDGEIRTEADLQASLMEGVAGLSEDEARAFVSDVESMLDALETARASDDPELRATAVLTCFVLKQAS